ncbi:1-acyl-sn-glycerol-3-phosphate acyltransferase [Arthrobacter crystallopoietes BAB-32]|uniref:1-acyl-sn-glycerol-3-phosphate acyltransferase n=1 Tax=Arthrobacter crystallopoietes BAB-32 TaxID=1246476 RepID=N1V303_9MICC|nr:lysophospholipid acyltransferase family protein [Arthrobacter crystallopoietes]EMY32628.1 1-acyl-sn-glycerol-3-phosphate acyltransferase [Arthrobacter crystallopoietes BAB-32]
MKAARKERATIGAVAALVRPVLNLVLGREWSGGGNLPKDQGFIVCPNHNTEIDPLVVGHYIYNHGHIPHFLAKASLFRIPVVGAVLQASRQIPVERSSAGANKSLEAAREVMADGGAVLIYPEGTLTRDPDLWPMRGRTGAARLALQTGAPVVPVAHWGANALFPRYARKLRLFPRKTARVIAGPPVDLSEFHGLPVTKTVLEAATDKIMDAITELLAELRNEEPPARRWDPAQRGQSATGRDFEGQPLPEDKA